MLKVFHISRSSRQVLTLTVPPRNMTILPWSMCLGCAFLSWLFTLYIRLFIMSISRSIHSSSIRWLGAYTPLVSSTWLPNCTSTTACRVLSTCPQKHCSTAFWTRSLTTCSASSWWCRPCTESAASETMLSSWFTCIRDGHIELTKPEAGMPHQNLQLWKSTNQAKPKKQKPKKKKRKINETKKI